MDGFPFYNLGPKERLSKLTEHFFNFEQEATKRVVQNELQLRKNELIQAASLEPTNNEVILRLSDRLLIEAGTKDIKNLIPDVKEAFEWHKCPQYRHTPKCSRECQ